MSDDPFAPPAPAEAPSTTTPTSKETRMSDTQSNSKLTVTLKGGSGFDAPWIVLHGDTASELLDQLNDSVLGDLIERTQTVGQHFASKGKSAPAATGGGRQGQPAGSQTPPAGAPDCPAGWTYKEGVSKAGKAYKGFFPPRGDESKPIFFN